MFLKRKKKRPGIMVPVASMGDIAFLLIIFFMVTSIFVKEGHVVIEQPSAPDLEELKESAVSVTMMGDGTVLLQGEPCDVSELRYGVEALLESQESKVVMVKIDRNLTQQQYGEVFLNLSSAGATIALVGTLE